MKGILISIINSGHNSTDNEDLKTQKSFLIFLTLFMNMGALLWGIISLFYGLKLQSCIPFAYISGSALNILYFRKSRDFNTVRTIQVFLSLILPFVFQWSLGGFLPSGFIMLWSLLSLIASLSFQKVTTTFLWLLIFIALTVFTGAIDGYLNLHTKPSTLNDFSLPFTILNITLVTTIIFSLVAFYVYNLKSTKESLKIKQDEIAIKNKQLITANDAKSRFLSTISHEIRTPLNGIIGISEILSKTHLSDEQKQMFNNLTQSGRILHSLINDVLDLSQIEENKLVLASSSFYLHEEIKDLMNMLQFQVKEKSPNIDLLLDYDQSIPEIVKCDLLRLKQILINLINNSIKFTNEGFIKVIIKLIEQNESDLTIKFEIKDSGVGISEENKSKLFEKFFQINEVNTEGSGLGLSIVRNLTEKMGGTIDFSSVYGAGSSFFFQIPFQVGVKSTPAINSKITHTSQTEDLSILLVEDNEINRMIGMKMLQNIGYTNINMAENGLEAFNKSKAESYDLILMDINMPVMGGIEATKKILSHCRSQSINPPVIGALTANALKHELKEYIDIGMSFTLIKPFKQIEIEEHLAKIKKRL